jgi:hypothetical protein
MLTLSRDRKEFVALRRGYTEKWSNKTMKAMSGEERLVGTDG